MFHLINIAAMGVMSLAAAYFFMAAGLGIRQLRRHGTRAGFQSTVAYGNPFDALDGAPDTVRAYHLYFLVPCLNEAQVIANTVHALCAPPGWDTRIIVVDDGSDDDTGDEAARAGGAQVSVVRRNLPEARNGKGAALNTGFAHIMADVRARDLHHDEVLVVVMDADGRLSDGAIHEVLPLFDDPRVGGVQLAVRIRNREDNFLLQFQDHQFWTLSSLTQFGRIGPGTVSLGGNGQFTRLSALLDISERPWSSSLTEDLDLAISMRVAGWRLTSTPRAAVDQQGLAGLRALVRQRTRWYQGHMTTGKRIPEVIRSQKMDHAASVEMTLYLLVPWLFDLPWSILYHLVLLEIALGSGDLGEMTGSLWLAVPAALVWYLVGFWPALVTAVMAKRRNPSATWARVLKLGHCFVATNYLSYACAWRALARMLRGQNGWTKTARTSEPAPVPGGVDGSGVHVGRDSRQAEVQRA